MQPEWISVNDRLPEMTPTYRGGLNTSGTVLTYNGHYVHVGKYEETFTKRQPRWISDGRCARVTHWMPLPEPPKGELDAA